MINVALFCRCICMEAFFQFFIIFYLPLSKGLFQPETISYKSVQKHTWMCVCVGGGGGGAHTHTCMLFQSCLLEMSVACVSMNEMQF